MSFEISYLRNSELNQLNKDTVYIPITKIDLNAVPKIPEKALASLSPEQKEKYIGIRDKILEDFADVINPSPEDGSFTEFEELVLSSVDDEAHVIIKGQIFESRKKFAVLTDQIFTYIQNPENLSTEEGVRKIYDFVRDENDRIIRESNSALNKQRDWKNVSRLERKLSQKKSNEHRIRCYEGTNLQKDSAAQFLNAVSKIASLNDQAIELRKYKGDLDVKDLARQKADKAMEELLAEENKEKEKGTAKKSPKKATRKKAAPLKSAAKPSTTSKPLPRTITSASPSLVDLRNAYALEMQKRTPPYKLLERVTRWSISHPSIIRDYFADRDASGNVVLKYKEMDDQAIALARAKHYFPNLEKVIANKTDRKLYTFETARGLGMMVEFNYQGQPPKYGVIYFGIQENRIYHKYFEEKNFEVKDIVRDSASKYDEKAFDDEEWTYTANTTFALAKDAVLTVNFLNEKHSIRIFPLTEKLDRKMFG